MKKKTWKSRLFALSLICSVIMSSAGVVFAGETDDIGPDPIAEESFGETSKEEFSELPAAPEAMAVIDESAVIPNLTEEDTMVTDGLDIEEEDFVLVQEDTEQPEGSKVSSEEENIEETAEDEEEIEEEIREAEDEEQLLNAERYAGFNGKERGVCINGIWYYNAANGSDGKGGTWKYDGNGNLELNKVHLTQIGVQGNLTITSIGNNYLTGGAEQFGLVHRHLNTTGANGGTETLTLTGTGKLYAGGGISVSMCHLQIIDTHIESYNHPDHKMEDMYVINGMGHIIAHERGNIIIRNSDVLMHNDETKQGIAPGIGLNTEGSLIIDNSNITIEKYGTTRGRTGITLKDCHIVDKELNGIQINNNGDTLGWVIDSNAYLEKLVIVRDGKTPTPTPKPTPTGTKVPSVSYRTHVQSIGWQNYVKDGAMSGTQGQAKRLEGIDIKLSNLPYTGGITYRTHVQTYGWQPWKSNGEMAGTSGEAKRLEAIQIKLTGEIAKYYDVYYQTHIQHFGWSGWAKNGEQCGSAGYAYRLEAIKIVLVKKGKAAPGSVGNIFYQKNSETVNGADFYKNALVKYNTHVQTYGWQPYVTDGAMSGTSGQAKRLEGIHIALVNQKYSGDIVYRTHVQTYGWQAWKKNGAMSGTSGEAKRLEGIQIYLTGEMANHYDVYYCVHAQTYGWLDWAKNGAMAGTSGLAKRLEGIKIVLVPKGGKAPGAVSRPNVVGAGGKLPDNPYKGNEPGTATNTEAALSAQTITISGLGTYDSANRRYNVAYTNQAKNIKASALGGATLTYAITDKTGKTVSSSIAAIDNSGNLKFTGKAVGSFYVTVRAAKVVLSKGGYAAAAKTFMVNVSKATPVITCSSSFTKYMEDGSFNLGAQITLGGTMKYASRDTSVLKVDSKGVVTPVKWTGLPKQKEARVTISSTATSALNAAKTVTVKVILKNKQIEKDTEKPKITNVTVSNITPTGYTVTCTVSDNVGIQKVEFPTWTETNGQDDIIWHKGTISGNKASFTVRASDHNNETDTYYLTDIYATDLSGNKAQASAGQIYVADVQINLDKTNVTLSVNGTLTLKATANPADLEVVWQSSAPDVVTVDSTGKITAKQVGTAVISVESVSGNASASCTVEVVGISLNIPSITLNVNETVTLAASVYPPDLTNQGVSWLSTSPETATVSSTGKITAKSPGVTVVRAEIVSVSGETYVAFCMVTVVDSAAG